MHERRRPGNRWDPPLCHGNEQDESVGAPGAWPNGVATGVPSPLSMVHQGDAGRQGTVAAGKDQSWRSLGGSTDVLLLDKLEVEDGLPPNHMKADATQWGGRVAWEDMKEVVQPPLRQRPPMAVRGAPGDKLEVAMDLTWDQVRSVVRSSGKCAGVEYWVGKPAPEPPRDDHRLDQPASGTEGTNPHAVGETAGGALVCRYWIWGPPGTCRSGCVGSGARVRRDPTEDIRGVGRGSAATQNGGLRVWIWP